MLSESYVGVNNFLIFELILIKTHNNDEEAIYFIFCLYDFSGFFCAAGENIKT